MTPLMEEIFSLPFHNAEAVRIRVHAITGILQNALQDGEQ